MPFHVPPNIAQRVCAGADLGFTCDERGALHGGFDTGWGGGTPYPPPGYLPWNRLDVGNGDTFGYYWPIGAEDQPPIVCTLIHDAAALYPLAGSLEAAVRLHLSAGLSCEEWEELGNDFGVATGDCQPLQIDFNARGELAVPYWGVTRADELLPLDPRSPSLLLRKAQEMTGEENRDLEAAERFLLEALDILPEYTQAWWNLAAVRRHRRVAPSRVLEACVNCLTSPLAFGHVDFAKCLSWLQRLPDDAGAETGDPIWQRRGRLTLAEGADDDYAVYQEAIDEYHAQGLSIRAVRLRVLFGELMASETEAFRQRKNFTWPSFWRELRRDCEQAGLTARLDAMPT